MASQEDQSLGGSGEIELAKRSLVTAKMFAADSAADLQNAQERLKDPVSGEMIFNLALLQIQADSAMAKVVEAEEYLRSVVKKWEAIEERDDVRPTRKRKRQKLSNAGGQSSKDPAGEKVIREELKRAIARTGLGRGALAKMEKEEFIELLRQHRKEKL